MAQRLPRFWPFGLPATIAKWALIGATLLLGMAVSYFSGAIDWTWVHNYNFDRKWDCHWSPQTKEPFCLPKAPQPVHQQ